MKKFQTYSKGKKAAIIIGIVAAVLAVGGILFAVFRPEPAVSVILADVQKGEIKQEIASSAAVESGNRTTFNIPNGTYVKSVNVKIGDKVKKGDVLATFDTSSLSSVLAERQKAYNDAVNTKNNAASAASQAKAKLPEVNKQIAELQKKVDSLEAKSQETASTTKPNNTETTAPATSGNNVQQQIQEIIKKLLGNGGTTSQIKDLMDQLNKLANGGFDLSQFAGGSAELIQAQMDLAQLKMQKSVLEAQSSNAMDSIYNTAVNVTKASYDEIKNDIESLKNGWVAENDGIVTAINIQAGQVYQSGQNASGIDFNSILSTLTSAGGDSSGLTNILQSLTSGGNVGMIVDNYDDFFVTISIGKYDLSRLKLGQKAIIKSVDNEYEGEVVYISPVAEKDSSFSINSITSSLTGGSSSNNITAKVKINNPGDDVIIGMDVDVSVITDEQADAILVPLEAVQISEDKKFVYVYKPEDKIVRKTEVRVGLASDSAYQITAGLNVGEQVVKNPTKELLDKSRVAIQKEEVSTDSAIYLDEQ